MLKAERTNPPDVIPPSASLRAGVARRDITPPVGIYARNWGASKYDVAEGVHQPLNATALAMVAPDGASPFVLVSFDGGWWHSGPDEWIVRGALIKALQLDPARVLINLTHSHAVPSLCPADESKPGGHLIRPYLEHLRDAIIAATRQALDTAVSCVITWATGRCDLATNRDLPDPKRERVVCGYNPHNQADDTVVVGRVADTAGRVIATMVNYACHPTTLAWQNRLISPDYVGTTRAVMERATGGAPCLFLQGASGELAPREQYTGDVAIAEANGRRLGNAALATLEAMLPPATALTYTGVVESGAPLATWERRTFQPSSSMGAAHVQVPLPLRPMPPEHEVQRELDACTDRMLAERLQRKLRVIRAAGRGPTCPVPAWAWRIGDALVVAHPNEAYSHFQLELRRRFPGRTVLVLNLTNGGQSSYLSPPDLYDLDIYQVWQSPFDRQALGILTDTCERELKGLLATK